MQSDISQGGGLLATIEVKATFIEEIKAKKFEYKDLKELKDKIVNGKTQDTSFDVNS